MTKGMMEPETINDIPIDHLDYQYISKCSNSKELQSILDVLQSGKEGRWPDLEKACEKRLIETLPAKERKLFIAQREIPDTEQVHGAKSEIENFVKSIKMTDRNLLQNRLDKSVSSHNTPDSEIFIDDKPTATVSYKIPPVRGSSIATSQPTAKSSYTTLTPEELALQKERNDARISGYDFDSWQKYDVDKELEAIDERDNLTKQARKMEIEAKQKEINERAARSASGHKQLDSVDSLTDEQREFFSAKEKEKGNECFKAGEFERAAEHYTTSIKLLPKSNSDPRPYSNRAMSYLKLERFAEAEEDCSMALLLDHKFIKAYARRGIARHRRGKYLDAIDDFEHAIALEPSNSSFGALLAASRKMYNQVGGIGADRPDAPPRSSQTGFKKLMIIEDSDDSESESDQEEEEEEEQSSASLRKHGLEAFKAGDYSRALEYFSQELVVLQQSESSMASNALLACLNGRSQCLEKLGMNNDCIRTFDEMLVLIPDDERILLRRAEALERTRRYDDALNDMCQVLRINPQNAQAGDAIARLMEVMKNPPPLSWETLKDQGNESCAKGKYEEAVQQYTASLEQNPGCGAVLSNRAFAFLNLGKYRDCVNDATAVIKADNTPISLQVKALYRRGLAYKSIGDIHNALLDFKQVQVLEPANTKALSELEALQAQLKAATQQVPRAPTVENAIRMAATNSSSKMAIPKSLYEFQKAWRHYNVEQRADYLRIIPLANYKSLFRVEFPEELLVEMIPVLGLMSEEDLAITKSIFGEIAKVPPFETTSRFLGQRDLEALQALSKKIH